MDHAPHLPDPLDGLLGRADELRALRRGLARERLVTLTGTAGIGKTRLALAAAATAAGSPAGGPGARAVRLVDLDGLLDADLLACTLSRALGLPDRPGISELASLGLGLAAGPVLLVLDGCERLAGRGAATVQYLLGACPELNILAVGRRAVGLAHEHEIALGPLAEGAATALLALRARRQGTPLPLRGSGRSDALPLCHLLDRNPLAIGLAAVQLGELSPRRLMAEIARPSGLLALQGRTAGGEAEPARNRSLRASAEWSHDLCTESEQLLWARLSVVPAGFDRAEAHRTCADELLPGHRLDTAWEGLLDGSVLLADTVGRGRYRLPALLRAYGREQLRRLAAGRHGDGSAESLRSHY